MLSRFRFAGYVAAKWLPASNTAVAAPLWDNQAPSRNAATKTPKTATQTDFLQKYMDVDNVIRRRFVEFGKMYEKFFDAQKDIEIPLDGDEAKVKKYHNQIQKIRESIGIPDKVQVMQSLMKEKKVCSRGLVRKWVKDLEDIWGEANYESMMRIVSDVEGEIKQPLMFPTKENPTPVGWDLFKKKYEGLMHEHGLKKPLTKEQILYEDTRHGLEMTVEHVQNGMDDLCEKLGIEKKFDARKVRTTLTRDIK